MNVCILIRDIAYNYKKNVKEVVVLSENIGYFCKIIRNLAYRQTVMKKQDGQVLDISYGILSKSSQVIFWRLLNNVYPAKSIGILRIVDMKK